MRATSSLSPRRDCKWLITSRIEVRLLVTPASSLVLVGFLSIHHLELAWSYHASEVGMELLDDEGCTP